MTVDRYLCPFLTLLTLTLTLTAQLIVAVLAA